MKATVTLKAIKDFDIQEGTNYITSYTAVLDFGSLERGGTPIDAYTKAESDSRFANKDDVYEEVHIGDDEPTDPRTKMWFTDEDLVEIVQEVGTSTSAVMSQDAVTKALASAGGDYRLIARIVTEDESVAVYRISEDINGTPFSLSEFIVSTWIKPSENITDVTNVVMQPKIVDVVWSNINTIGVGVSVTSTNTGNITATMCKVIDGKVIAIGRVQSYNKTNSVARVGVMQESTTSGSLQTLSLNNVTDKIPWIPIDTKKVEGFTIGSYRAVFGNGSIIEIYGK